MSECQCYECRHCHHGAEVKRLRDALVELGERGPCPHPEGNVCEHGIQWDLDCCWRCMKAKIAKALLVLYRPEAKP